MQSFFFQPVSCPSVTPQTLPICPPRLHRYSDPACTRAHTDAQPQTHTHAQPHKHRHRHKHTDWLCGSGLVCNHPAVSEMIAFSSWRFVSYCSPTKTKYLHLSHTFGIAVISTSKPVLVFFLFHLSFESIQLCWLISTLICLYLCKCISHMQRLRFCIKYHRLVITVQVLLPACVVCM